MDPMMLCIRKQTLTVTMGKLWQGLNAKIPHRSGSGLQETCERKWKWSVTEWAIWYYQYHMMLEVFQKKKKSSITIYDTPGIWNISLSTLYKEGNDHSFENDPIRVGDVNARLTQMNWTQITHTQIQINRLLHVVINWGFLFEVHKHSNSLFKD